MHVRGLVFILAFSETLECLIERDLCFERNFFAFFIGSGSDYCKQNSFGILLKRKEKGSFLALASSHRSQKSAFYI